MAGRTLRPPKDWNDDDARLRSADSCLERCPDADVAAQGVERSAI